MSNARVSVFTALSASGNVFVREAWGSLFTQSLGDFEWVVVENNGGILPPDIRADKRVRVFNVDSQKIGELKGIASELAQTPYIVELDHDDLLRQDALDLVVKGLQSSDFVFSDFAEFEDGKWTPNVYSPAFGWGAYPVEFRGHQLVAMRAPDATAQNLRRIEFAPNHVRAFRREAYDKVGGYNRAMALADDQDLVVRLFLSGASLTRIPECLYFYRVHGANTVKLRNADIQRAAAGVYARNIDALARKFAADTGGLMIDLSREPLEDFEGFELNGDAPWKLPDSSVAVLRAADVLCRHEAVNFMNEAHRVLMPGGFFQSLTPSTDGRGAFQDPGHSSFWNVNSFWYYTQAALARYVPRFTGRFQVSSLETVMPTPWHKLNSIPYVEAHLFALKDGYVPMGEVLW